VDFDPDYAGVFSYVLGDTLVVDDMDTAREFMGDFRMVTLEGDLVEKSGAMTGGSSKGTRYSFSGGQGQLERIAATINDLEDERQSIREDLRDVEDRLDDARDKESAATEQVRDIETEIERRESERAEVEEKIDSLTERLSEIEDERDEVSAEMDEIEAEIDEKTAAIEELQAEIDELESEVEDSELPKLTSRADEITATIDDLEGDVDDIDAKLNEFQLEKEYAEDAIEELHEKIETAQNRKAEKEERIAEFEENISEKEAVLEEKREAVAELESELAELKDEREDLKTDLKEARRERDEKAESVGDVERDLESLTDERERLEWEVDELEAAVGDYDPEEIPDHEEVESEIARLEGEMEALEPVNMLAIDEYDSVADDLADLEDKKGTLVEEAEGIRDRIDTYEQNKKQTFMESYDAINEQFRDIFERLSNGTGTLHLENDEDPFDGGLTMKAQPGDKPIQRLNAMSGGEKSLTALAFIFAIQRHNPAPFYALDEVDAFLDAANADLVGEMVDELAGKAQFVVVSHRSAMLERSERAIGVTMQDDNVSAVTGIDLSAGGVPADD
jgi:chromosome segregation protein